MTQPPHRSDDDWQPATSEPGETLSYSGQMRASAHFLRNLRTNEPRAIAYRRTIARQGWWFLGLAVGVTAILIVLSELF